MFAEKGSVPASGTLFFYFLSLSAPIFSTFPTTSTVASVSYCLQGVVKRLEPEGSSQGPQGIIIRTNSTLLWEQRYKKRPRSFKLAGKKLSQKLSGSSRVAPVP